MGRGLFNYWLIGIFQGFVYTEIMLNRIIELIQNWFDFRMICNFRDKLLFRIYYW